MSDTLKKSMASHAQASQLRRQIEIEDQNSSTPPAAKDTTTHPERKSPHCVKVTVCKTSHSGLARSAFSLFGIRFRTKDGAIGERAQRERWRDEERGWRGPKLRGKIQASAHGLSIYRPPSVCSDPVTRGAGDELFLDMGVDPMHHRPVTIPVFCRAAGLMRRPGKHIGVPDSKTPNPPPALSLQPRPEPPLLRPRNLILLRGLEKCWAAESDLHACVEPVQRMSQTDHRAVHLSTRASEAG